jgi:hypothetical protein
MGDALSVIVISNKTKNLKQYRENSLPVAQAKASGNPNFLQINYLCSVR